MNSKRFPWRVVSRWRNSETIIYMPTEEEARDMCTGLARATPPPLDGNAVNWVEALYHGTWRTAA